MGLTNIAENGGRGLTGAAGADGAPGPDIAGLTSDGANGIAVAGQVQTGSQLPDQSVSQLKPDSLTITAATDDNLKISIAVSPGSSGTEVQMLGGGGAPAWRVNADGSELLAGSVGVNGATPPGYPVLATGAAHTVDDVITLLQSYGLCKQS